MNLIDAYQSEESVVNIDQLPMSRDWMDRTFSKHSYHCFPMTLSNRLGWGISLKHDFCFIWDGEESSSSHHINIIKGQDYVSNLRGNKTISIDTGLYISPQKNISILTMPPPNIFIEGLQCISTIISTSAMVGPLPIALMANIPNKKIYIKAGTILASILPVKLSEMNETELHIKKGIPPFMMTKEWTDNFEERSKVSMEVNSKGGWNDFYRDAIDHRGVRHGEHEAKKIIMKVVHED
jgi:hypothetical protein